jgi:hypothetical protein
MFQFDDPALFQNQILFAYGKIITWQETITIWIGELKNFETERTQQATIKDWAGIEDFFMQLMRKHSYWIHRKWKSYKKENSQRHPRIYRDNEISLKCTRELSFPLCKRRGKTTAMKMLINFQPSTAKPMLHRFYKQTEKLKVHRLYSQIFLYKI